MNITSTNLQSKNQQKLGFGRAFTDAEKREYTQTITKARNSLGINNTAMILFDTSAPSEQKSNTGVGTSFSDAGQKFIKFMKDMTGINTVQQGPQGSISKANLSPFSGSVFALGEHLVDLKKLVGMKLLSNEAFKQATRQNDSITTKADFNTVLGSDGTQRQALKTAFANFKALDESSSVKQEFNTFKQENADWLERDSLYEGLAAKNGNDYWKNWTNEKERELFSGKYSEQEINEKKEELNNNPKTKEAMELHEFTQFIADKQQKEAKTKLNKQDIKLFGDCLVGFSPKEEWSYKSAFKPNHYLGCWSDGIQTWGLACLDTTKLGNTQKFSETGDEQQLGEAGKLLKKKFDAFFKKYDGARIDAAWELVKPFIYEKQDGQEARKADDVYLGDSVLKIMDKSAKTIQGAKYSSENLNLELLGGPVAHTDGLMKGRTQIQHSVYQSEGWGNVKKFKNDGMQDSEFTFGLGTHDDLSLDQIADSKINEQAPVLAKNLGLDENTLKNNKQEFKKAKFAEIFTARNNFFTVFDALGQNVRFNDQRSNPDNWTARVPDNYEEIYHRNLAKGDGLNTPDALAKAMKASGKGWDQLLINKLNKAADVLKQDGPMTQKEANNKLGKDFNELNS